MKKIFFAFLTLIFLGTTACKNQKKTELTILAAASLTDICSELKTEFEKANPDIKLFFSFGGSGALQAQIEAGAPCDIFISASTKQMNALLQKDLMKKDSVKNLLKNEVVLIAPVEEETACKESTASKVGDTSDSRQISSFEELASPAVKMIALGEPSSVPVGQYSRAIFENLGIWDKISQKANFASDVRTVLNWVEESACDYGLVYQTDAAVSHKVRILARAPQGSCPPVIYPVGIIKASTNKEAAQEFVDFLFSKRVSEIYSKAGFNLAF